MHIYELAMQIKAETEDEARAIAVERIQRNDGFDLDRVGE